MSFFVVRHDFQVVSEYGDKVLDWSGGTFQSGKPIFIKLWLKPRKRTMHFRAYLVRLTFLSKNGFAKNSEQIHATNCTSTFSNAPTSNEVFREVLAHHGFICMNDWV